ncbi:MAG TPA: hypothetical protein VF634_14520, partial [Pyrinomonadaceae bacterium]
MIIVLSAIYAPALKAQSCATCDDKKARVGFTASGCSGRNFAVSLNGTTATGTGSCTSNTWMTTGKFYTELKVDQTYQITAGTDSCSTHIAFDVPDEYTLEIDGVETDTIDKGAGGTAKGSGDGTWNVVVRRCKKCAESGGGAACRVKLNSVDWSVSLGKLSDGRSAQTISIIENMLSASIYTPSALLYSPPGLTSEVDVVRAQDGSLRQVKAPQNLADVVVTIPGQEYELRFYRPADVGSKVNGVYGVSGQPFIVWKIKNPDPASISRVQISKIQGATTETNEYAWDAFSGSWSLNRGNGARIETKAVAYVTATSRIETSIVKNGSGQVISKSSRTIHTFPWGDEVLREEIDPDGAALTTVYTYYEDSLERGRYSKVKSIIFADGSWEQYDYDEHGNRKSVMRPWKDLSLATATEANSYVTKYTYSNFDGVKISLYPKLISSVVEQVAGVTVRKTTYARSNLTVNGQPASRESRAVYSASSVSQTTITTSYHSSAASFYANRIISIEYPEGRKVSFNYEKGTFTANPDPSLSLFTPDANGTSQRVTATRGTTSAPDGVAYKTTRDVSILNNFGLVVLKESYAFNGADYERFAWAANNYDTLSHPTQTRLHNGQVYSFTWNGDLKASETNAAGVETTYTYDALRRVRTETKKGMAASGTYPAQPDITTTYDYDAEGRSTSEVTTGGGLSQSQLREFDVAGRLKSETSPANLTTKYTYAEGGRIQTVTYPGGATEISDKYLDGRNKSITGTAVVARYTDYGINPDGTQYTQEFSGDAGLTSPRWSKITTDWLDRTVKVETPSYTAANLVETFNYDGRGLLISKVTKAGASKL